MRAPEPHHAAGLLVALTCACSAPSAPTPDALLAADALGDRSERWTQFLTEYLAVDTTNPPGHEARAFPLLQAALSEIGLSSTTTPMAEDRGNVWARLRAPNPDPSAGPLILLHHIDVVPVERDKWTVEPFAGEMKQGALYGRGAIDMKQVGALQLAGLEHLAKNRDRLRRDIIFLAVSDEEVDGLGAQLAIEKYIDEWKPEYLLDEGGFSVRDFMNGFDICVIATTQKRPIKVRMTVDGEAGHGSRPIPNGGSRLLAEALHRIDQNPRPVHLIETNVRLFEEFGRIAAFPKSFFLSNITFPGMLWMVEGSLSKNKNLNPMIRDTITPTVLRAGDKANVIPAEATAIFDIRMLPDTNFDDVLAHLRASVGDLPVRFEPLGEPIDRVPEAPTEDPLFDALVAAVRSHEPAVSVAPWTVVGANDSRFFAPRGVKTYGFAPVFLSKAQLDTIHGHDEHVTVSELQKGMTMYAEALARFALRP